MRSRESVWFISSRLSQQTNLGLSQKSCSDGTATEWHWVEQDPSDLITIRLLPEERERERGWRDLRCDLGMLVLRPKNLSSAELKRGPQAELEHVPPLWSAVEALAAALVRPPLANSLFLLFIPINKFGTRIPSLAFIGSAIDSLTRPCLTGDCFSVCSLLVARQFAANH